MVHASAQGRAHLDRSTITQFPDQLRGVLCVSKVDAPLFHKARMTFAEDFVEAARISALWLPAICYRRLEGFSRRAAFQLPAFLRSVVIGRDCLLDQRRQFFQGALEWLNRLTDLLRFLVCYDPRLSSLEGT